MESTALAADRYCRVTLPRVSRTFALNIRLLRGDLGISVRLAYLLCRLADTLEDAWDSGEPAHGRFGLLAAALGGDESAARAIAALPPPGGPAPTAAERDLVAHAPLLFSRLRSLPAPERGALIEGVTTLARGMERFVARVPGRRGLAYLADEEELHLYCYAVAGCVGEMLTRLFMARAGSEVAGREAELMRLAPAFGEGLQLTNILLDLREDLGRDRCYLPQRWLDEEGVSPESLGGPDLGPTWNRLLERLGGMASAGLDAAWRYTLLVPRRHWRYRLFCAWPVLWGAASLRAARAAPGFPARSERPRITRAEVRRLALAATARAFSNRGLRSLYARVRESGPGGSSRA